MPCGIVRLYYDVTRTAKNAPRKTQTKAMTWSMMIKYIKLRCHVFSLIALVKYKYVGTAMGWSSTHVYQLHFRTECSIQWSRLADIYFVRMNSRSSLHCEFERIEYVSSINSTINIPFRIHARALISRSTGYLLPPPSACD